MEKILSATNRKVFIVSEYTRSEQNSTGYFWEKLISKLEDDQFSTIVINPPENLRDIKYDRFNVIRRGFRKVLISIFLFREVVRAVRADDVLVSGTNPVFLMPVLAIAKLFRGFKWTVFVSDVFPENLAPAGIIGSKNIVYSFLVSIFSWSYKSADRLLAVGRDMQKLLSLKVGTNEKVRHVPHWVDLSEVDVLDISESCISDIRGLEGKIVFQFFGNMGKLQDIPNLLEAISLTKSPVAAFVFIGAGTESVLIQKFIEDHPEKPVYFLGELQQSKKNLGLAACDVAIVSLIPGMAGLAVPSKSYFSLAAGRPLLAVMDDDAEISNLVREEQVGWCCPPGDPVALSLLFDEICFQREKLKETSKKAREVAELKYSQNIVLELYKNSIVQ